MISSSTSFSFSIVIGISISINSCVSCISINSAPGRLLINCYFYIWVRYGLMEELILYELIPCINKAYVCTPAVILPGLL